MRVLAFPRASDRNPYTSLLYDAVERLGAEVVEFDPRHTVPGDVMHVHWPEWFLGRRNPFAVRRDYAVWMRTLRALKSQGTKIVWTAHNLRSHERRHESLQRRFWAEFVPLVDGCICLSARSQELVREAFPQLSCAFAVVPHGHYRDVYPRTVTRAEARKRLGLGEEFVFVHVGMVREYKNVPALMAAFAALGSCRLIVAGEVFDEGLRRRIEGASSPGVLLSLERVADEDLQRYFRAADLAVFPYRDILNSGSALMALSFDVPVLVPALGSMPELREQVGSDWVMTYSGDVTADVLREARAWVGGSARAEEAPLGRLEWAELGRQTLELYRRVVG
jgi:glycosyltransferase involved in cell wall biosynthesis